jgi:hypothetical protein
MELAFLQDPLVLFLIILWTLPWKGVALWKAARLSDKAWFVAILILSTLAILDILYIFIFSKRKSLQKQKEEKQETYTI